MCIYSIQNTFINRKILSKIIKLFLFNNDSCLPATLQDMMDMNDIFGCCMSLDIHNDTIVACLLTGPVGTNAIAESVHKM
jgi:hypothetical protein